MSAPKPSQPSILFARSLLALLPTWPILSTAISESWGGPSTAQKLPWLAGELVDSFFPPDNDHDNDTAGGGGGGGGGEPAPDAEWVEEMLLQVMEDEFDVVVQDGSAQLFAREIVRAYEKIVSNSGSVEEYVRDLEEKATKMKGRKINVQVKDETYGEDGEDGEEWEDEDGASEDGEEAEAPELMDTSADGEGRAKAEPVVDEEGFTLVQGKGKGRR